MLTGTHRFCTSKLRVRLPYSPLKLKKAISLVKKRLGKDIKGKCYIASEAVYHLAGGKKAGLKPFVMKAPEGDWETHWFLKDKNENIIDLTAKQFSCSLDYNIATGKGFLTKKPSKKAKKLIED